MDGFVIAALSVGALSALALIGALSSRQERLAAPEQLELAQAALARGELDEARRRLLSALHQPLDDRFGPKDAEHALQSVSLLDALMQARGLDASATLAPLRQALTEASRHGGLVPRRLTSPARALLSEGAAVPLAAPSTAQAAALGEAGRGADGRADAEALATTPTAQAGAQTQAGDATQESEPTQAGAPQEETASEAPKSDGA